MSPTTFDEAVAALQLAEADPGRSVRPATEAARRARRDGDDAAGSVAVRALGIAALHLQDADVAARHLRRAAVLAGRAERPELATEARLRLAAVLNVRGRPTAALREVDAAAVGSAGLLRARALAQRGAILLQLGRLDAALDSLTPALPELRAAGDRMWLKRALANRGMVLGHRFRFAAAEADLLEALRINEELGIGLSVAFIQQNLGWLSSLRGSMPAALGYLDAAEVTLRRLGAQLGFLLDDRAGVLLAAGLVGEARSAAVAAVAALERERQLVALPAVRLRLARVALAAGDPAGALVQGRRAVRELARQNRPEWTVLARFAVLAARAAAGSTDGGAAGMAAGSAMSAGRIAGVAVPPPGQVAAVADELAAAGWPEAAVEARLLAASLAWPVAVPSATGAPSPRRVPAGRRALALAQLTAAATVRRRGPAAYRALGWHAEALLRLHTGRAPAALQALRTGLRVLDEHRAALGAADLRVHAARHRIELATLGLRTTVATGRPGAILTWAEHGRASHLLLPPLHPPDDDDYARDLAELRAAGAEVDAIRAAGGDPAAAVRRQVATEGRIRDRARRQPGTAGAPALPVRLSTLAGSLAGRALVEYVELDGMLAAVVVAAGRASWHPLGPAAAVADLVDRLPFGLRRLAAGRAPAPALRLLTDAAGRLDAALLAPVAARVGDRPLVLVPTGRLQSLPWSLLPSCAGRPVTVAPSATLWHAAQPPATGHRATGGHPVVVAGPGLPGAVEEADAVAALHGVPALHGATVDAVLARLAGADVAHFATHGQVHADHPLFSSLLLADGPLTGYDLERLRPVPRLVVLAACDTGRHVVRAGDELLGLTATFLARGAGQVVASVVPVPDVATAPLMTAFHRGLVAGRPVAEALADAQAAAVRDGSPTDLAAAAGFVAIGG
jgi:tetratricopeptide (TPR) repeat protein